MKGKSTPPSPSIKNPPFHQKVKLFCCHGGILLPHHPTGELHYLGGEARIVSVDRRGLSLSKLVSKLVSELRIDRPFSLRYAGAQLVWNITTDDDVRLMIEDHDRLLAQGITARLRLFLCAFTPNSTSIAATSSSLSRSSSFSRSGRDSSFKKRGFDRGAVFPVINAKTHLNESKNSWVSVAHICDPQKKASVLLENTIVCALRKDRSWQFTAAENSSPRKNGVSSYFVQGSQIGSSYSGVRQFCDEAKEDSNHAACTKLDSHDASDEVGSVWGHNVRENGMKAMNDANFPRSGGTSVLEGDCFSGPKSCLDLSMDYLSIPSFADQSLFSSPCSSNFLKPNGYDLTAISTLPTCEAHLRFNARNIIKDGPLDSKSQIANMAEEVNSIFRSHEIDIPSQGTAESRLLRKLPELPISSAARLALHTKRGLVSSRKNQESIMPTSIMEKKDNVAPSENNCSNKNGKTVRNISQLCSQFDSHKLQTIKYSDLEEIRELGSGAYGTVFYGKWKGSDVAIKRLKPSCFDGGELGKEPLVADFWKEACLLAQLHHPNVVAFYGVVTDSPVQTLATVTEYMVNGSLKQVLQRKDRTIDRRKRIIIAMDAAFGMEYLHEKSVVHFDLKSHNLMVNMRDPHRPVCKIGDLGLSKVKLRTLISGGVRGTIPWMAPELLTSKSNMVTEKVDVYSFGIIMWELLTGEEPYGSMRYEKIIVGIMKGELRPEIPIWCDPAWRSLMERCWSRNPSSRPAFSDIAKELRAIAASVNIK